jgi:hypothetical protein
MVESSTSSDVELALMKNRQNGDDEENDEEDDELEEELFGDNGDEDEFDKGAGPDTDQSETEGEDDLDKDNGDDELIENDDDEDDELVEDEDDDEDDDEDEFDLDEYSSTLRSNPQKAGPSIRPELSRHARSRLQGHTDSEQKALPLEYIDLEAT